MYVFIPSVAFHSILPIYMIFRPIFPFIYSFFLLLLKVLIKMLLCNCMKSNAIAEMETVAVATDASESIDPTDNTHTQMCREEIWRSV